MSTHSQPLNERLSALMDGELPAVELDALLEELAQGLGRDVQGRGVDAAPVQGLLDGRCHLLRRGLCGQDPPA